MEKEKTQSTFKFNANLSRTISLLNTNFNLLNMAIAVGMDKINRSGSKMPHKCEHAYSHFAPCNLERNIG